MMWGEVWMLTRMQLGELPDIEGFRKLMVALAALDTVMCPDWEFRYYAFEPSWGEGEAMASMRNGSGDQWFAVLCPAGVALVGLAHESPSFEFGRPKPWVFRGLPEAFEANLRREPAFEAENATFCIWRSVGENTWCSGVSDAEREEASTDGSDELLGILRGDPTVYARFATDYFEREPAVEDIAAVYRHEPIDAALATRLNPEVDWDAARDELIAMGFPVG